MDRKRQTIHPKFKLNGVSIVEYFDALGYRIDSNKSNTIYSFILNWLDESSYMQLETSGTTGNPKVIKVNKKTMFLSAKNTGKYFGLKAGDSALLCLPITFVAGKMMIIRAIVLGLDLYVSKPSSSPINTFSRNFDFVAMTPLQLEKTINYIHKIKCLIIGGSPVNSVLKNKIKNTYSGVFETYGMTETVSHVAVKNLSLGEDTFKSLPGITFSQKFGCLEVNAPFISSTPIQTNDKVQLISNNSFRWIGRNALTINSGGIKFNPEEIERLLSNHYSEDFVISSLPDSLLGEKIVLVFEKKIPTNPRRFFSKLKKHQRPKEVAFLNKFERKNGKINREKIKINLLNKYVIKK